MTESGSPSSRLHTAGRRRLFALACSAALLGLIVRKIHPERLGQVFAGLHVLPALAALACIASAGILLAVRWRWMLQLQGVDDGFPAAWAGVLVGNALSAALLGALLGDVVKSGWYSRRHHRPYANVLLACGLDRMCGGFGLLLYGTLTLVLAVLGGMKWAGSWEWRLPPVRWVLISAVAILMVLLVVLATQGHRLRPILREGWARLIEAWNALRVRPGRFTAAVGVSLLANLLIGATLGFSLASVGSPSEPWVALAWTFPVIGLVASMPFTFAGAGAREGAAIAIWSGFGIPAPVAVAACLVTLAVTLLGAIPGSILFSRSRRKSVG